MSHLQDGTCRRFNSSSTRRHKLGHCLLVECKVHVLPNKEEVSALTVNDVSIYEKFSRCLAT